MEAAYRTDNTDVDMTDNSLFWINICPTQYRIQTPTICSNFVWKQQDQQNQMNLNEINPKTALTTCNTSIFAFLSQK